MRRFDLVIFDLDGTLVDASPDLHTAVNLTLEEIEAPPRSLAEIRAFIGDGARELVYRSLPDRQKPLLDQILPRFFAHYGRHVCEKTFVYPGIDRALAALTDLTLVVASNKPERFTNDILRALGWLPYFRLVVGGDSLACKKPDPRVLTTICSRLQLEPYRAVMVGDGPQDIEAAHAAGMSCVGVTWGFSPADLLQRLGADHLVSDTQALTQLLLAEQ